MDYLEMIRAVPAHRTALIEDSNCYTYGSIVRDADEIRHQSDLLDPGLEWIDEASVYGQLIRFLAYSGTNKVPVIISRETCLLYTSIINAHGGQIRAGNHQNGAQFTFTLPDWREY